MDVWRQGRRSIPSPALAIGAIERGLHTLPIVRGEGVVDLGRRLSVDQPEIEPPVMAEALLIAIDDELIAERFEHCSIKAEAIRHSAGVNFEMIEHDALPFDTPSP
jgi:hypothetical protein